MSMTRPRAHNQTKALAGLAVGTAALSFVALRVIPLPREWQVALCLVLLAALGAVAGAVLRTIRWVTSATVLTVVTVVVFALSSALLYRSGGYYVLATLLFLPAAALVAFAATHVGYVSRK